MEEQNAGPIGKLVDSAKNIIVVLPPDPSQDMVSAATALHFSLKDSGHASQIGCGTALTLDSSNPDITDIPDSIGSKNLIISFDYKEEYLEKVDYDIRDDGHFYLMIKPKSGAPVPDASNVKYSYSGAEADLIITIGVNSLEELGKIYAQEKAFLDNATVLNLHISNAPASFTPNYIHKPTGSFCELVAHLIQKSNLKLQSQTANRLLQAIHAATGGLTSSRMTADTFETIAFLMRSGARLPNQQAYMPKFSQPPFFEIPQAPQFVSPVHEEDIPLPDDDRSTVPSDWKKPKIFRAGDQSGIIGAS